MYDASNWNYLLLINVLNQVKHSDQKIDATLIKDTAELIERQAPYSEYKTQLSNAVYDITAYFNELELYGYLTKVRDTVPEALKRCKEIIGANGYNYDEVQFVNLKMDIGSMNYYATNNTLILLYNTEGRDIVRYYISPDIESLRVTPYKNAEDMREGEQIYI